MARSISTMNFLLLLVFVCSLFPPHTCDPDHAIDGHEAVDPRAKVAKKGVKIFIIPCAESRCKGGASASGVATYGLVGRRCWCCLPTKKCFWAKDTCWANCPQQPPSPSHSP